LLDEVIRVFVWWQLYCNTGVIHQQTIGFPFEVLEIGMGAYHGKLSFVFSRKKIDSKKKRNLA
jgi:hypothetical protein